MNLEAPKYSSDAFIEYWNMFIGDIEKRENLKPSHLYQLRMLCDLCVEYDELKSCIDLVGRTYESIGRNGTQYKLRPEVLQMNKIFSEVRNYSRMLGLVLAKDTDKTNTKEEANEFE